jgi:hypothetical protein
MKLATFLLLTAALSAAELKLGKPLTLKETTPIPALLANPDAHLGKVVQVKGKITEVCQNMGCWMVIVDEPSGKNVRIKVKDGEIEFPKNSAGKKAVAEGKFTKIEMSKEQAIAYRKHEAEENKKPFDPASVTGGMTLYQLAGQGAVIVD